jgi:general secretion pathway protein G
MELSQPKATITTKHKGVMMIIGFLRLSQRMKYSVKRISQAHAQGFSLIELLIVMVILGLLASLVGPKMFGKLGMAKQKTAKTQIEMLMTSLDAYRLDVGSYPSSQEGLEALVTNTGDSKWDGPYLAKSVPLDPWGQEYVYSNPGQHGDVEIVSYGLDNQPGGTGENTDVTSWE